MKKKQGAYIMPTTKLEWAIDDMYGTIDCEGDYLPTDNYIYHFIMDDEAGWNVYIEDRYRKDYDTVHWQKASPYEHFDSKADLITNFRLRDDGRTILEYLCDKCGEPRLLVAPFPVNYYQEGSKYN